MIALVQRVSSAAVSVGGKRIASIDAGLLALACAMPCDTPADADRLADRIGRLRILPDEQGKMNLALVDADQACLVVSAFTLAADAKSGRRPYFGNAAKPELAQDLCTQLAERLRAMGIEVREGQFGANMQVELVNDGPVALMLDSS